ncbi:4Fe-4S binding protein [bacterium]|nr:4Fe-4S binding protein [bacterium]
MRTARRISQMFFLLLFFGLFLWATYPLKRFIPVDIFFRFDPLVSITASLAARSFILKLLPGLLLLTVSIFLGRFFCGWICPLGFIIDIFNKLFPKKNTEKTGSDFKWIKYFIFLALFTGALFSIQVTGLFDPFSILTRSTTLFLYPLFVITTEGIFNALVSVQFLEDHVYQLWDVLTGSVLPASQQIFKGSGLIALIFIIIVSSAVFQRRFWCRNICPLGALYGLFSKFRIYKRNVSDKCTACGMCRTECRMDAISEDYLSTNNSECISCMDCVEVCPVDAVKFSFSKIEVNKSKDVDLNRRRILAAGLTGIVGSVIVKNAVSKPSVKGSVVRPPGSVEESKFLDLCIRCGECVRVCSTSGAGLQHALTESGFQGIWTPVLFPETGYCEYNCNLCGEVCPTGAIKFLPIKERQQIKMGTAHFDKTRCIPWYYGEDCMVCEEHCPLPDKAIKFRKTDVVTIDGKKAEVNLPYVIEDLCIGCGICVNRCPLEGKKGIFLTNADEQRL